MMMIMMTMAAMVEVMVGTRMFFSACSRSKDAAETKERGKKEEGQAGRGEAAARAVRGKGEEGMQEFVRKSNSLAWVVARWLRSRARTVQDCDRCLLVDSAF